MPNLLLLDPTTAHLFSWNVGWALILAGFASGAAVGLRFHQEGFWGGYGSLRRRLVRLGHVACVALGVLNLLFALGLSAGLQPSWPVAGAAALAIGGLLMPTVCFLSAWRPAFRHLFAIPVLSLCVGAVAALSGGLR